MFLRNSMHWDAALITARADAYATTVDTLPGDQVRHSSQNIDEANVQSVQEHTSHVTIQCVFVSPCVREVRMYVFFRGQSGRRISKRRWGAFLACETVALPGGI